MYIHEGMNKKNSQYKNFLITIRVNSKLKSWLKIHKLSPSKIFNDAVKKLGYDDRGKK